MQIQWKVILLVLVVLIGTTSAIVWKTQALVLEDKIGFLTDSNIKQIAPLRKLVESKLGDEKETLIDLAAARAGDQKIKANAFGDFDVVSLVQPNDSQTWAPVWIEHNPNSAAAVAGSDANANPADKSKRDAGDGRWAQGYDLTLLKSLNYSRVKNGEVIWTRLSDHQGLPIYAVMMAVEVQDPPNSKAASARDAVPRSGPGKSETQLPETTDYSNGALAASGSGNKAVVVGFASGNPLATVTEEFIGSSNSVYLVDDHGYVASHNNRGYLGALFSEDPVAKEIIKTQKNEGTGRYEDLDSQRVLSHYERVDGTNLFAVISAPMAAVTSFGDALARMALITAALVGLVGLLLAWFVGQSFSESIDRLSVALQNVIRGGAPSSFQVIYSKDEFGKLSAQMADALRSVEQHTRTGSPLGPVGSRDALPDSAGDDLGISTSPPPLLARTGTGTGLQDSRSAPAVVDRRAAYEAFSEGLNELIKQPLMAILGHVQLTRAKTDSPEIRAHVESIEREARRVKETMDRLRDFDAAPVAIEDSQVMHLDHVVASALESVAPKLEADDIELDRHTEAVPEIHGDSMQMQSALAHVLENAREAVRNQPTKRIAVTLFDRGDRIVIEVKDTGIGMSRDVQQKVFEPFFKNFDSPARLGLGLAFVASAMKRIEAKVEIESSPGEGTCVRLTYPVTTTERASFQAAKSIAARGIGESETMFPPRQPSDNRPALQGRAALEDFDFENDFSRAVASREDSGADAPVRRHDLDRAAPEPGRETTLGGRVALDRQNQNVLFPPAPQVRAEDMISQTGAPEASTSGEVNEWAAAPRTSNSDQIAAEFAPETAPEIASENGPENGPENANDSRLTPPPLQPRVPKQPPAGASTARVPQSVREQRLANAMESIAAAASLFDDEDEAFTNVSLGQALSNMKSGSATGGTGGGTMEAGTQAGFKVKIRKPRVKS